MLNQWHFTGNQVGSCQPVMSYSEAEAPQWRSLCWKQRCDHFSISLFCFFWFLYIQYSLLPLTCFPKIILFSEASQHGISIFRLLGRHSEPQSLLERCLRAASNSTACCLLHLGGQGPRLPSPFTAGISKSIYCLVGAKLAPVTMKTHQMKQVLMRKVRKRSPDKKLRIEYWKGLVLPEDLGQGWTWLVYGRNTTSCRVCSIASALAQSICLLT